MGNASELTPAPGIDVSASDSGSMVIAAAAARAASTGESSSPRGRGAISGAVIIMASKIVSLLLALVTTAVIARLVSPADYGLVTMVLSITAFLTVPGDFGLSLVTVQKPSISHEQLSTLFWVNVGFGGVLGLITVVLAPLMVRFYHDERLLQITLAVAATFPVAALGVQHEALVKRQMLFGRLAVLRLLATGGGGAMGILMAWYGWGYWALVGQSLTVTVLGTVGAWLCIGWLPGLPRGCAEMWPMLRFGGNLTAHGMAGYFANSLDKVLLGRCCGAYALGLYANAYTLMAKVLTVTGYSVGEAAIPAMSRSAGDFERMRSVFRRMLEFTCLIGFPISIVGVAWADEVVQTLLGPKWTQAGPLVQLLFLAALPRVVLSCTGWVYVSGGRPDRMLRWQLFWSPLVVVAFVIGLKWSAVGVAAAYAIACWISLPPALMYCFKGTRFGRQDILQPMTRPLACALAAWAGASSVSWLLGADHGREVLFLAVHLLLFAVLYGIGTAWSVPLVREGIQKARQRGTRPETTTCKSLGGATR